MSSDDNSSNNSTSIYGFRVPPNTLSNPLNNNEIDCTSGTKQNALKTALLCHKGVIGKKCPKKKAPPAPETATSSPTRTTPTPPNQKRKTSRVPFGSPAGEEQQKNQRKLFAGKNLSFVELDKLDETLLKKAAYFIRQRL